MRIPGGIVALLAFALTAHGGVFVPSPEQRDALSPIDTVPTVSQLDRVFGPETLDHLVEIAIAVTTDDLGVQLRAIHALSAYCPKGDPAPPCGVGTQTHDTLATIIDRYHGMRDTPEIDTLRLRAAIEALGISARSAALDEDVTRLVEQLDHQSRDIRAATAKALGALCNTQAIQPLRIRLQTETTTTVGRPQVRLAISAALRDLVSGQCAP